MFDLIYSMGIYWVQIDMKKLLILLFSILISFNSYGEWMDVTKGTDGSTHYLDPYQTKKHDGYVYYWDLVDYLKPTFEMMSNKTYYQGECGVNRFKTLSYIFYKQPMGEGSGETINPPNPEWSYPSPESVGGIKLKLVCFTFTKLIN